MNCTTDAYDSLYARWLENPGALLDWARYMPEQEQLLDLCGGTGAISKAALDRGAKKVWLLDLNPRLVHPHVVSMKGRAEDLETMVQGDGPWDLVVCRQALGYLNIFEASRALRRTSRPGTRLVFNTFTKPKFALKSYLHKGRVYFEASGYLGKTVMHLQATDGDFDITRFRWWTNDDIRSAFADGWVLENFKSTPSTLWYQFCRLRS